MLGSENSAAHPGRHFEEWPIGNAETNKDALSAC